MDEYVEGVLARDDAVHETIVTEHDDRESFEATVERAERIDGAVVVAVTDDDGRVLLVENDWMDGFGFPGGVEPGEDPEAAAVREVAEETIEAVGWFDEVPDRTTNPELIAEALAGEPD